MNEIPCVIKEIIEDGGIAFVSLLSSKKGHILKAMLLVGGDKLKVGKKINAVFKESEVMICDKDYYKISARNRFISPVLSVEYTQAIARVKFEFENSEISSLISREAYNELGIEIGKEFGWFVKSSEVMLEYA